MFNEFWYICILITSCFVPSSWQGLRDDLVFLFEEEISHIQLCSLHQEMRNTEQLLGSLGLFSNSVGCLRDCNEALSKFGPENTRHFDRIYIKLRPGQQTAVAKNNVQVSSMSGIFCLCSWQRACFVFNLSVADNSFDGSFDFKVYMTCTYIYSLELSTHQPGVVSLAG